MEERKRISMKKEVRRLLCLALVLVFGLLGACGAEKEEKEPETLYPVSLKGVEVRVGETTVQSLLDQGLQVTWVNEDYERIEVEPSTVLEAESYYTGGNVKVSDSVSANISFVTGEQAVPLGEAVIARLEFNLSLEEDPQVLEQISFDGVPVSQLTREMAGEKYPGWSGDEVMWLQYGLEYKYSLIFDPTTGKMTQFTVEREYDVDWLGE